MPGDSHGMGASHGGRGGNARPSNDRDAEPTYGSVRAPTTIGAGGFGYTGPHLGDGGGALRLAVSGAALVDGDVLADGLDGEGSLDGGGAGGSIGQP